MQVVQLNGHRAMKREQQLYGIEIEVENVTNVTWAEDMRAGWRAISDGSLRDHGMEFITAPCTFKVQMENIRNYYYNAGRLGYRPSIRTGIHVHVDMRWRTLEQVAAICALYAAVEPALFSMCGPDREECIYCVPWYRSTDDARLMVNVLDAQEKSVDHVVHALNQTCKYSALYLEPLKRFGTIEFRAAPTFESAEQMAGWLRTIQRVVRLGHAFGTAEKVAAALASDRLVRILQIIFPDTDVLPMVDEIAQCDSVGVASLLIRVRQPVWQMQMDEPLETTRRYHETRRRDTMRFDAPRRTASRWDISITDDEPEPDDFRSDDDNEEDDN